MSPGLMGKLFGIFQHPVKAFDLPVLSAMADGYIKLIITKSSAIWKFNESAKYCIVIFGCYYQRQSNYKALELPYLAARR